MKINPMNDAAIAAAALGTAKAERGAVPTASGTPASESSVTVSAAARSLDATAVGSGIDEAKVSAVKAAIADGSFKVDAGAIADKLLSNAQEFPEPHPELIDMPDTRSSAEALLGDVERQLDLVDTGLMTGEPTALQSACGDLRRVAVSFAGVLEAALSAEAFDLGFRRRVEAVAQRLSTQRESLARRNVVVERALASIMRPSAGATYTVAGERGAFGGGRAMGVH